MEIAKEITNIVYKAVRCAWGQYDPTVRMKRAEEDVAAKLEPVKELLERIKSDVVCEGVPLKLGDEYDKECSPKMALSSIGEKAIAALALFEEEG